jgi:cholesterol transport system auxiliary component
VSCAIRSYSLKGQPEAEAVPSMLLRTRMEKGLLARLGTLPFPFSLSRPARLRLVMLLGLAALCACSTPPRSSFDLLAPSGVKARAQRGQLAVLTPVAIMPASSDRIVVRTSIETVAYLSGAQWVDQLPVLLQARLIETFENAHAFRGVGRVSILADYTLNSEIRRFELDSAQREVVVEIFVRLSGAEGRAIGSRLFIARRPVPNDAPASVASGLNAALGEVMHEIVVWTAKKV